MVIVTINTNKYNLIVTIVVIRLLNVEVCVWLQHINTNMKVLYQPNKKLLKVFMKNNCKNCKIR